MGKIIMFAILGLIGYLAYSMVSMVGEMARQAGDEREMAIQATVENPQSFEDHAMDTNAEIAEDGLKAAAAIALSADVSQTKIAEAIPNTFYALGFVIMGIAVLIGVMKWGGSQGSNQGAYISSDSFVDHNRK